MEVWDQFFPNELGKASLLLTIKVNPQNSKLEFIFNKNDEDLILGTEQLEEILKIASEFYHSELE